MKRATAIVIVLTAIGSIFAYGREALLAATFGVSGNTDAYFAAIFLPFALYSLLGAGALNPVVIPVLSEYVQQESDEEFWRIASIMLNFLIIALGGLTAVGIILAPQLLNLLAPGFDAATQQVAVQVLRVALPMTFLAGIAAYLAAVLNALGSFAFPALNTVIISGCVVIATVLSGTTGVVLAATGWSIGSAIYLLLLIIVLARKHPKYHRSLDLRHPTIQRAGRLILPMALFMLQAQLTPLLQRSLATFFPAGDLSRLNYASRLAALPNTIFTTSLALVLLPILAQQVATNRLAAADEGLGRALRVTTFFLTPAVAGLAIYSIPIVRLIFQRGQFSATDSVLTGQVMAILALGAIPLGLSTILHDAFFSRTALWTLLWLGALNTVLTLVLMIVLQQILGVYGLALAFSVGQLFYLLILIGIYRMRLGTIDLRLWLSHLLRVGLATGAMSVVLIGTRAAVSWLLPNDRSMEVLGMIALGGLLGGGIYLIIARILHVPEAQELWVRVLLLSKQGRKRIVALSGTTQ